MYGANDVGTTVSTFLSSDLAAAIEANDESGLEKILAASNKYFGDSSNELQFSYRLGFYGGRSAGHHSPILLTVQKTPATGSMRI